MKSILCGSLSLLALANAQFYGSYGRNVLIRPHVSSHSFPFQTESRLASPQPAQVNTELAENVRTVATQISRGSEMFSFDMFRVSILIDFI